MRLATTLGFCTVALIGGVGAAASRDAAGSQLRCGWFSNPSPANASLYDRDGEWLLALQGGHQAEGNWSPNFRPGQQVTAGGGSYGYGCACLNVRIAPGTKTVVAVVASRAQPLSKCRRDKSLAGIEASLR